MHVTLSPTNTIEQVNGQECRVWEGQSDLGASIRAYIALIGAREDSTPEQIAQFSEALKSVTIKDRHLVMFDMRMVD